MTTRLTPEMESEIRAYVQDELTNTPEYPMFRALFAEIDALREMLRRARPWVENYAVPCVPEATKLLAEIDAGLSSSHH